MRELSRRIWYLFRRRRMDADLAEELEFHRTLKAREFEAEGLAPADAALDARRALGSTALTHDHAHDVWVPRWLQDTMQDVRFALRLLAKERQFAIVAVLVLSLGLAVNNTFFTIIDTLCLRGLQIDQIDRVLTISTRDGRGQRLGVSYRGFRDIQATTKAFASVAASTGGPMTIGDPGRSTDRAIGMYVSADAFTVLRQQPLLGRSFLPQDDRDGADAVVLLGYGLWQSRYGGSPSIVGRAIRVNSRPALVVGIMPDGFKLPDGAELWEPLAQMPQLARQQRDVRSLGVFGRLADGATMVQAQGELSGLTTRLAHDYPETNKSIRVVVSPMNERYTQPVTNPAWISFILAGSFVLLIACANVANLLLMHAAGRTHEIAMRVSLGATRLRIVRQLLVESALLAVAGGGLGFAFSTAGLRWFVSAIPSSARPFWTRFQMDSRVFAVLCVISLATVFIFGLVPALHLSATDVHGALKEGSRGGGEGRRTRRRLSVFLTVELALTMMLLYGMGMGVRSVFEHSRRDLAIDPAPLLTAAVSLPDARYPTSDRRLAFYERLIDRLDGTPPIAAATVSSVLPLSGAAVRQLAIEADRPTGDTPPPTIDMVAIASGYFRTMNVQIPRGRMFDETDGRTGHESAIVNQRFADLFFAKTNPIGRRIRLTDAAAPSTASPWLTIVGISPSIPQRPSGREPDPVVYLPLTYAAPPAAAVVIRTDARSDALAPALREAIRSLDADVPVYRLRTMDQVVSDVTWNPRLSQHIITIIALIGLLLSAVGLYAVTAQVTLQRTREIGVRVALGARRAQIAWLVLRRAMAQLAWGLLFGLFVIAIWNRPWNPSTGNLSLAARITGSIPLLLSVSAVLVVTAIAASLLPARRAAGLDPVEALRHE